MRLTLALLAAAGAAAYIGVAKPHSTLAVQLIEFRTAAGVPAWAVLAAAGIASLVLRAQRYLTAQRRGTGRHGRQSAPFRTHAAAHQTSLADAKDWLQETIDSAKNLDLPAGARLTHNSRGSFPFELHLEHAPPERCRRAVEQVALWLVNVPLPPRLRIHFHNCPEGGSPRHHQVAGSLSTAMDRAAFKVTKGLDSVDVLFLRPDPRWSSTPTVPSP